MSHNEIQEKYLVVAAPGHNVMLTVDGKPFMIDSYHPVRLGSYFDEKTLDRCDGLQTSLTNGTLVVFTGQELAHDPNDDTIASLRVDNTKSILTTPKQTSPSVNQNLHVRTETDIDDDFRESIQNQVQVSKKQILDQAQAASQNVINESNIVTAGSRPKRVVALRPDEMGMSVSMDVAPEQFKEQREDEGRRKRAEEIKEELNAHQQVQAAARQNARQSDDDDADETPETKKAQTALDKELRDQERLLDGENFTEDNENPETSE